MKNIIKSEFYKTIKTPSIYLLTVFGIAISIIQYFMFLGDRSIHLKSLENYLIYNFKNDGVMALVTFVLVVISIHVDNKYGILKNIFGRGINRKEYLISKIICLFTIDVALNIIFLIVPIILLFIKGDMISSNNLVEVFLWIIYDLYIIITSILLLTTVFLISDNIFKGILILIYIAIIKMIIIAFIKLFDIVYMGFFIDYKNFNFFSVVKDLNPEYSFYIIVINVIFSVGAIIISKKYLKTRDIK